MNKTPISILQELMVKEHKMLPRYIETISDKGGFNFACIVLAGNIEVKGYGSNKKEAKQNSAYEALLQLNFPIDDVYKQSGPAYAPCTIQSSISTENQNIPSENYVGKLNEYSSINGKQYPRYIDNIIPLNGRFKVQCQFLNLVSEGYGNNKKTAKQESAKKMFELLKEKNLEDDDGLICSIKDDTIDNINRMSEAMMKKYEQLSISDRGIIQTPIFHPMPCLEEDVYSLQELKEELGKYGYEVEVKIFQRKPYIAMLKVSNTDCVLMGHGDTESEAHKDLLKVASLMFRNGFSFAKIN